jgi:internalin A
MLVVGQGSVGKTSLIRQLTKNIFNPSEIKTNGIAINRWQVINKQIGEQQPESLRVNLWDFGGQEIMHATHQFFLTRRSLYLLVLDSRLTQEENRVEYWLKIIQSFGGDSPVLLVGNKTDQHLLDIDRTGLQKKYPNIIGILETSAATGAGLEELKLAITEQVNALPHVRDSIPEAWFNVKAQLEELGHEQNYISRERYEEKCAELEVRDKLSQRTLIGFLHDLGIVLHFQDDPRLEALGILNPQWVTNGVYRILNDYALFQNKGVLERSMLAKMLPEDDYPANKRLFIVDMMRKFELCYDIVPEQTFLVPDLLPKDEPFTGEWDGALAFQYHYNVLPSSIVSRFIVRMNAYIHKTVWRAGVVLQKDGNTALVKADTEERKIYIWVNGAEHTRRDFLSVIRAEFDAIHKSIIKIEAIQKVPHPDYPDLVLDYAELLQFERDNIAEFPRSVDGKTIIVNVRQLLSGVRVGSESAPGVKSAVPPAVEPVKVETAPVQPAAGNQSLLVKILSAIFVSFPRIIGRFALDIFGRDKAIDSTAILLGYALIALSVLAVWGIVDVNSLRDWFVGWWRFFFPVKP